MRRAAVRVDEERGRRCSWMPRRKGGENAGLGTVSGNPSIPGAFDLEPFKQDGFHPHLYVNAHLSSVHLSSVHLSSIIYHLSLSLSLSNCTCLLVCSSIYPSVYYLSPIYLLCLLVCLSLSVSVSLSTYLCNR